MICPSPDTGYAKTGRVNSCLLCPDSCEEEEGGTRLRGEEREKVEEEVEEEGEIKEEEERR